jgi:low temperature requirement protein LtrA
MPAPDAATERRTTPVELFWDLVFVFAVTQVSTLLHHDLSWAGLGRALLVLALPCVAAWRSTSPATRPSACGWSAR